MSLISTGIATLVLLVTPAESVCGGAGEGTKDNGIVLARDRKAAATIVAADHLTEPEKLAVRELAHFLGRVTGASLPIVAESSFSGKGSALYVRLAQNCG